MAMRHDHESISRFNNGVVYILDGGNRLGCGLN